MRFTRRRNSKHIQARTSGGRYTRPTVVGLTGMDACRACNRFYQAVKFDEGPFPMPMRVTVCPHCGKDPSKPAEAVEPPTPEDSTEDES